MIAVSTFPPVPCFCSSNSCRFDSCRAASQAYTPAFFMIDFRVRTVTEIDILSTITTQ